MFNNLMPSNRRAFGVESLIEKFFNDPMFSSLSTDIKVDIKSNAAEYIVEAAVPGVPKEQLNVDYNNNYLTISVESKEEYNEERENYICKERKFGKSSRSFYIENVDENNIKAHYNNGVLKVILPKSNDDKKKNSIQIQ